MAETEPIEKIGKISKKETTSLQALAQELERQAPNKEQFDRLLASSQVEQLNQIAEKVSPPSIVEEVQELNQQMGRLSHGNPEELMAAADGVAQQINAIKEQLQVAEDSPLNSSTKRLLTNRLGHIDESLKIALDKVGVEYVPPPAASETVNPIERFLGFLTHGQHQLETLSQHLQQMQSNGKELGPAAMILIQIKVGTVQQEVEFFTSMLNKALESTKTIMNVQV